MSGTNRAQARSTHPQADQAAEDVLGNGGSALKAALTGFFAAAGADPGVLFSPLSLLVVGLGAGARAYDGRCRQPGIGGKRPRGFLPEETIPPAARAAVPASVAAAAVAAAYHGGVSLAACVRPAVAVAKRVGAPGRSGLLARIAELGPNALHDAPIQRAWLARFGPQEGGTVTSRDLSGPADLDAAAVPHEQGDLTLPWAGDQVDADVGALGDGHALVAIDVRGQLVALAFWSLPHRLVLEPYQTHVPALARPVMRNVSRTAPGSVLQAPCHLAVRSGEGRAHDLVRAVASGSRLELSRDPVSKSVVHTIF